MAALKSLWHSGLRQNRRGDYMRMSMVISLVIASLLFGGCGHETKRTAAEPVPRPDQRGTVPNDSVPQDRLKKPPVRQREEPPDRTKAVRYDRNENEQQVGSQTI